jgi:hypothetical protein
VQPLELLPVPSVHLARLLAHGVRGSQWGERLLGELEAGDLSELPVLILERSEAIESGRIIREWLGPPGHGSLEFKKAATWNCDENRCDNECEWIHRASST